MAIQVRIANRFTHEGFDHPPHMKGAKAIYTFVEEGGGWEFQHLSSYKEAKHNAIKMYSRSMRTNFGRLICIKAERPASHHGKQSCTRK